jgi:hypothetical protein
MIPAKRTSTHFGDVSHNPCILKEARSLYKAPLPWGDDEMQSRDLRLWQEAARDIQGMALQSRHVGGE